MQGLIRACGPIALLCAALGCGGISSDAPARAPAPDRTGAAPQDRKAPGLETTLGELADRALAEGALGRAEQRYGRMLGADSRSLRAHPSAHARLADLTGTS